jgi:hypothetical protein
MACVSIRSPRELVGQIRPHDARAANEGRTFIQSALQNTAAIEPIENELHINLKPLSSPHRSKALAALCEILNQTNTQFAGTKLTMRFSAEQAADS